MMRLAMSDGDQLAIDGSLTASFSAARPGELEVGRIASLARRTGIFSRLDSE